MLAEVVGGSIVDTLVDTWTSVMDVNMKSTFMMCKYVLPHMYEVNEGHVVIISSNQAFLSDWECGRLLCFKSRDGSIYEKLIF